MAASWANIALLDTWQGLFDLTRLAARGGRPSAEAYWTAVLVVFFAAAVGAFAVGIRQKVPRYVRIPLGDISLILALISISTVLWRLNGGVLPTVDAGLQLLSARERLGASIATLFAAALVWRHWRSCMRAGKNLLLLLSPFLIVTIGRASVAASKADFATLDGITPSVGIATARAGPRVVIIVFDELDYIYAFGARPERVHLPFFDQLRSESVFATNVSPPAGETGLSLPSYMFGRPITSVSWRPPHSVAVRYLGEPVPKNIDDELSIFSDAAQLGASSELVGSFLPYCRWSFAALLERCTWRPMTWGGVFDGPEGIGNSLIRQILALVVVGNRSAHIARIEQLTAASVRAVSDSTRRLIFLHLPIPHFPPVWDARHDRYSLLRISPRAYFDNLVLADNILSRIRIAIDRGATAEPTFLIVTSDHPWRYGPIDGRVGGKIPFFVRTPSAKRIEVSSHVDAVRLRALTSQLLDGKLTTAQAVASWLASPRPD